MFDRIVVAPKQSERLVPYTKTVIEKRAPTDESVKLLGEMEKAAIGRILSSWELSNNDLSAQWHVEKDMFNNLLNVHLRYRLNGVTRNVLLRLRHEQDIVEEVRKRLIDELAATLLQSMKPARL